MYTGYNDVSLQFFLQIAIYHTLYATPVVILRDFSILYLSCHLITAYYNSKVVYFLLFNVWKQKSFSIGNFDSKQISTLHMKYDLKLHTYCTLHKKVPLLTLAKNPSK